VRLVLWILKALVFFTLFAFALNNQHTASVKWFFGVEWQAPMIFVVLASFAAGCALGVLAMVPGRWRRSARKHSAAPVVAPAEGSAPMAASGPAESTVNAPPRDGL
jgi:putative membrane protein